ncbi:hypothetical protein D3C76_532100 [compost metagenome]
MQLITIIACCLKSFVQLGHPPFGPAENNSQVRTIPFNQCFERLFFITIRDFHDLLFDIIQRNRRTTLNNDIQWLFHVISSETFNRIRHRRREQHRLTTIRNSRNNGLYILQESHMQHLIGFVQNEHLNATEIEGLPAHMIQKSARCTNDKMSAAFQLTKLLLDILTTINGQDFNICMTCQLARLFRNLQSQLTCRSQDQRLRISPLRMDLVHNWQQEGQSLPCTCLCSCNYIQTLHQWRNRFLLHWCRLNDALTLKQCTQ